MRLISELITERDMLDFSQGFNVQRNYLGSRLFPDQKTQYIEAEYSRIVENGNLPTVAMIHGFDTEAHIASRVPFERVVTEQLLIKEPAWQSPSSPASRRPRWRPFPRAR